MIELIARAGFESMTFASVYKKAEPDIL